MSEGPGISLTYRAKVLRALCARLEVAEARRVEALAHAISRSDVHYVDKVHQLLFNLDANPKLHERGRSVVLMDDAEMAVGTVIEDIETQRSAQKARFEQIVQEKYDRLSAQSSVTALRCRRCGSDDVSAEQKQTRGADEAMTVFCTCAKCSNRWTMR